MIHRSIKITAAKGVCSAYYRTYALYLSYISTTPSYTLEQSPVIYTASSV